MARTNREHPVTQAIRNRITSGVSRASGELAIACQDAAEREIGRLAQEGLDRIAIRLARGETICAPPIRVSPRDSEPDPIQRVVRLGVFPVNGNPLHWGHLLFCLRAIAVHGLDLVVVIIQGYDRRKHRMSAMTERYRHEMARDVISVFEPLLVYSDIGRGTSFVGEENVYRLLRLNSRQKIAAHYMAGADHYRSVDDRGRPDTLPMLERIMTDRAMGFDPSVHSLRVLFAERGVRSRYVPSSLDVSFIPSVIDTSSTAIRNGQSKATTYEALRYMRRNPGYQRLMGMADHASSHDGARP